ncbi:unnamed protein product [Meloidogyne enterolobii]|uniref:Uncharacterized protein n=1 Tax=Meloidogyne enterolobii TaxID=390850 RepID=A0ACB0ZHE0_MELEN
MIKFSPIIFLNLIIFSFFLYEIKSANIDKFKIPEIPIQHSVSKQRIMEPAALQKYKECVAICAHKEFNIFPLGQKAGKHNFGSIQKCSDGCNKGK